MNDNVKETAADTLDPISEQIGASKLGIYYSDRMRNYEFNVVDASVPDYAFWDSLRRGKAKGLELAAPFVKAIGSKKAAWVLGKPPIWETSDQETTDALNAWWRDNHPDILRAYNESADLGDCYIAVNGDLTLTVIPPSMVTRIVDERDYTNVLGWRVTMVVPYPKRKQKYSFGEKDKYQVIEYEYYDTHTIRSLYDGDSTTPSSRKRYRNPSRRNPIVPIHNLKGADEVNGRPETEPFLPIFVRYTDILDTALKANIRQGRPTPVIKRMGDIRQVEAFWNKFGTERTQYNPSTGKEETIQVIAFDPDVLMTLGGDAEFSYESPGSFSADTVALLQVLFNLIVEGSELPEFVWGGAIGSSKASAETQLEPFIKWILKQRGEAMNWVNQLTDTVLAYMGAYNRNARGVSFSVQWRPIASADGRLMLDSTTYAFAKGFIDPETALYLLPLGIDNPQVVLDKAIRAREEYPELYTSTDTASDTTIDDAIAQDDTVDSNGEPLENLDYEAPVQPMEHQ